MKVVAYDPYFANAERAPVAGVELAGLDELLAASDFVTLHVPLMEATRGLLSAERIAAMKPGARLINAARGGLVDEAAVLRALESGQLAGAAFDVLADEPPGPEHPLVGRDDVIITPHIGASSGEAALRVATDIAHQVARFLLEGRADNAVNAPAVAAEELAELGPYLRLAGCIGEFLARRAPAALRKLEVTFEGGLSCRDTRPLSLALLAGVLSVGRERPVNFVNAPLVAAERDVRLLEGKQPDAGAFQSRIKVRASCAGGGPSFLVSGTVFGERPRFVRIDDLHVDLAPEGTILITSHDDVPGVLGLLGSTLGAFGVNIRRVELGKPARRVDDPAAAAAGFLVIDREPSAELLAELGRLGPIRSVACVCLGEPRT